METTIVNWGYIGDNGEENGNYYSKLGLHTGQWKRKWKLLFMVKGLGFTYMHRDMDCSQNYDVLLAIGLFYGTSYVELPK